MTFRVEDLQNDTNWKLSLGEKLNMIHFRNGHSHAECDPYSRECSIHYDEFDPNESATSLVKHMWDSKIGKLALVGAGLILINKLLKDN